MNCKWAKFNLANCRTWNLIQVTSNPHTPPFPHTHIYTKLLWPHVQTASDHPTFLYKWSWTHVRLSLSNQASLLQTVEYKICETTLKSVTSQRDLGVIVTNTLSWSLHYGKLCQKAYNALHLIKQSLPESAPVTLKNNCIFLLFAPSSLIAHKSGHLDMPKTSHA